MSMKRHSKSCMRKKHSNLSPWHSLMGLAPIDLLIGLAVRAEAALDPLDEPEGEASLLASGSVALFGHYTTNIGIQQNLPGAGGSKFSMMGTKKAPDEKKLTRGIEKSK
jgi:hypothetical protein